MKQKKNLFFYLPISHFSHVGKSDGSSPRPNCFAYLAKIWAKLPLGQYTRLNKLISSSGKIFKFEGTLLYIGFETIYAYAYSIYVPTFYKVRVRNTLYRFLFQLALLSKYKFKLLSGSYV